MVAGEYAKFDITALAKAFVLQHVIWKLILTSPSTIDWNSVAIMIQLNVTAPQACMVWSMGPEGYINKNVQLTVKLDAPQPEPLHTYKKSFHKFT